MTPLEYLVRDEWDMGNGQCPECHGVGIAFCYGAWGGWMDEDEIGHKDTCALAKSIEDLGGSVIRRGGYRFPDRVAYDYQKASREEFWSKVADNVFKAFEERALQSIKEAMKKYE